MALLRGRLFSDQDLERYAFRLPSSIRLRLALTGRTRTRLARRVRLRLDSRQLIECLPGPALDNHRRCHCGCPHGIVGRRGPFRRSIAAHISIRPKIWPSFFAGQLDPSARSSAQVREPDPIHRFQGFPCSMRRRSMKCSLRLACRQSASRWKWWRRFCGQLPYSWLGLVSTALSPIVVNEQRREIAIRLALGAQTRHRSSRWFCAGGFGSGGCRRRPGLWPVRSSSLTLMAGLLLRRVAERSAYLCWCHPGTYHRRARGQLYPGFARDAPRSNHDAPLRMTSWHCSRLVFASCGDLNNPFVFWSSFFLTW